MGVLQKAFDKVLRDESTPAAMKRASIRNVAKELGHVLTDSELSRAVRGLNRSILKGRETFCVRLDQGGGGLTFPLDKLADGLESHLNDFSVKVTRVVSESVVKTAPSVLRSLYSAAPSAIADRRRITKGFERRLRQRWWEGLKRLRMLLMIAQESHESAYKDFFDKSNKKSAAACVQFDALLRLHARACKTMSEIIALLETGHADGAIARWRSLHETAIIMAFLGPRPMNLAARFLEHSAIDRYKSSLQYQKHARALGYRRFRATEMRSIQADYDRLIAKYGKSFGGDYGWAAHAIKNKASTFAEIERKVRMQKWRPFYRMASQSIHSGSQGLQFSLGLSSDHGPKFLVGVSNGGLCDPGHCAAISLMSATIILLTRWSNIDHLVVSRVMLAIAEDAGEHFLAAHEKLVRDEANLHRQKERRRR